MQGKADKDIIRKLEAEIGNLKVQNAEYSQIVAELSKKLQEYNSKYGRVFVRDNHTKNSFKGWFRRLTFL